jgi:IclR family KDG regulon transcriptional repressor
MAAPIFNHLGKPIAAISVSFPLFRFDETRKDDYISALTSAGMAASEALGYQSHR